MALICSTSAVLDARSVTAHIPDESVVQVLELPHVLPPSLEKVASPLVVNVMVWLTMGVVPLFSSVAVAVVVDDPFAVSDVLVRVRLTFAPDAAFTVMAALVPVIAVCVVHVGLPEHSVAVIVWVPVVVWRMALNVPVPSERVVRPGSETPVPASELVKSMVPA